MSQAPKERDYIREAYEILFSVKPVGLEDWQTALDLVARFDGRKFVSDPKKKIIACAAMAYLLLYINFPEEDRSKICRTAAGLFF